MRIILLSFLGFACTITAKKPETIKASEEMAAIEENATKDVTKVRGVLQVTQRLSAMIDSAIEGSDTLTTKKDQNSTDVSPLENPFFLAAEIFSNTGVGRARINDDGSYQIEFSNTSLTNYFSGNTAIKIIVTGKREGLRNGSHKNERILVIFAQDSIEHPFEIYQIQRNKESTRYRINFDGINAMTNFVAEKLKFKHKTDTAGTIEIKTHPGKNLLEFHSLFWKKSTYKFIIHSGQVLTDKAFLIKDILLNAELDNDKLKPISIMIKEIDPRTEKIDLDFTLDL